MWASVTATESPRLKPVMPDTITCQTTHFLYTLIENRMFDGIETARIHYATERVSVKRFED